MEEVLKRKVLFWGGGAAVLAIAGVILMFWLIRPISKSSKFGEIWQVYTFKPEVSATAYESKRGNATIIWVSDLPDLLSEFGEIWQVYTFKPEITATAYQSEKAGATIIWVSGMDNEPVPSQNPSS